jgi:GAF domain-containing protein
MEGDCMTKFYIISGSQGDRSFDLKSASTSVGRTPDNDIQIKNNSVSRRHMKISRKGDKFLIEDLKSKNGTWVSGKKLKPGDPYEVEEGTPIFIGKVLTSLGKKYFDDGMTVQYQIDLLEKTGEFGQNLLYKDSRVTKRQDLETIHEVSTILMQSLNINEICEKTMESLFSLFDKIDNGTILLIDIETGQLKEILARSRNKKENIQSNYSRTIVNRVISDGKAVIMADTSQEDSVDISESIQLKRIKSIMCVPLISKWQILGVVYVHSVALLQGFERDDLSLLTALSSPVALAIQNALLYSQRRQAEEDLAKAHEELQKFNQELEKKVQERTEELKEKNNQLVKTEKLAAVGKMANRIAHELRNPLTVVGGFTRRLHEKMPDDDSNKKYLSIILKEAIVLENKISEIIRIKDE